MLTMSGRRARGDSGQAAPEYVSIMAILTALVLAVSLAFASVNPSLSAKVAQVVCKIVTLGSGGDCGSINVAASREPTTPCAVQGKSEAIKAGIKVVVGTAGNRTFAWTQLSDGSYKVQQLTGGEVSASLGAGAKVAFVLDDTQVGAGADASIKGGVVFQGGQEWVVPDKAALDRLVSAENWDRIDAVVGSVPGGSVLPWLRKAVGLGETFPPPDRVYVELGGYGKGSAYAGADGAAAARAEGTISRVLGVSYKPNGNGEKTYYFKSTTAGAAIAGVTAPNGTQGARLSGSVTTMTSVTLDAKGNIVGASRTGLAVGDSAGLTSVLFGGDLTTSTTDKTPTGTQYNATLDVKTDADRQAVYALLTSAGIDSATAGLPTTLATLGVSQADPLGTQFLDAVRDRGTLTRNDVTADTRTPFAVDAKVAFGPVAGLEGNYSRTNTTYSGDQYWNGTAFVPRSNC